MKKQTFPKIGKAMTIVLIVFFVISLAATTVNAGNGGGTYGGYRGWGPWGLVSCYPPMPNPPYDTMSKCYDPLPCWQPQSSSS